MAETALAYGVSDSGKTTLCVALSKWMYAKYGLTTRLVSCDLGGWKPVASEGLIEAGIVDAINIADSPTLLADIRKITRGWWPEYPVVEVERDLKDGKGMRTVKIRNKAQPKVLAENSAALAKVGLYFIEGATSMSDAFMRHLVRQEVVAENGKVQVIGPQGLSGRYEEDGEVLGGNSKGHYNVTQVEMHGIFAGFSSLPCKLVFWTSHVGNGQVKRTGESCYAPQLAGEAKNHLVSAWVGDCFYLDLIPELRGNDGSITQPKEIRAWFTNHTDPDTTLSYLAKTRVGPSGLEALYKEFPEGFLKLGVGPDEGLDRYFEFIEERISSNMSQLMQWKMKMDENRKEARK